VIDELVRSIVSPHVNIVFVSHALDVPYVIRMGMREDNGIEASGGVVESRKDIEIRAGIDEDRPITVHQERITRERLDASRKIRNHIHRVVTLVVCVYRPSLQTPGSHGFLPPWTRLQW
jgi:hypothetical protein